jgi:RsiW-degrading membrane proteinase PrsW (M82 family)
MITTILLALIPVFIYMSFLKLTLPWKSISFSKSITYFITGISSVVMIMIFFRFFPGWQTNIFPTFSIFGFGYDTYLIMSFIQVALLEELCKFFAFRIGDTIANELNPVSTMFYCGVSYLGFAFVENIQYANNFGTEILLTRSILSMYLHFLCGCLVGYWVGMQKLKPKTRNRSFFELFLRKHGNVRRIAYYATGVFLAVMLHGIFDFGLFTKSDITDSILIIMCGTMGTYFSYINLNNIWRRTREQKRLDQ